MFVYSFKTSKKQLVSMLLCVVFLVAILLVVMFWPGGESAAETFQPVEAADDGGRVSFLGSLGYVVTPESVVVREILIPDEFDETFASYNELQKTAGMDLEPYHGKRVKCWTYEVENYPGQTGVLAHLYVYKDKIIGGDIASTALDGFMHALTPLNSQTSGTTAPTTAASQ